MKFISRATTFAALTLTIVSVGGCAMIFGSTKIEPVGARVESTIVLKDAREFHVAQLSGNRFATIRTIPYRYGHIIEGFDSAFGIRWQHDIPFDRDHLIKPVLMSGAGDIITLIYNRYENDDSLSIHGLILDASSGAVRQSRQISGIHHGERPLIFGDLQIAMSPDSSHFALYRYDHSNVNQYHNRKMVLQAELFDTRLNRIGNASIDIPVNDEADPVSPYIGPFVLSDDGHGYQISFHDTATMRVLQVDFATGTARKLERTISRVDFAHENLQLHETRVWTGTGQDVIIAASQTDGSELTGIALVGMNFSRMIIDFVNFVEITETVARRLADDRRMQRFNIGQIIRMPGGEIILPMEQVEEFKVYKKDISRNMSDPHYRNPQYQYSIYTHGRIAMMGFNAGGESIWLASQARPNFKLTESGYKSDAWRVAGDTIHYIYFDQDLGGIATGTIAAKTGSISDPKTLIETSMLARNDKTKWLEPYNAMMVLNSGSDIRLVRFSY